MRVDSQRLLERRLGLIQFPLHEQADTQVTLRLRQAIAHRNRLTKTIRHLCILLPFPESNPLLKYLLLLDELFQGESHPAQLQIALHDALCLVQLLFIDFTLVAITFQSHGLLQVALRLPAAEGEERRHPAPIPQVGILRI